MMSLSRAYKRLAKDAQNMRRRFKALSPALRALTLVIVLGASIFLLLIIMGLVFGTPERLLDFLGKEPQQANTARENTSSREDGYLSMVEHVHNNSVESFLEIDGKLAHYDSVTPNDLKKMKADYTDIGDSLNLIDNFDPPQGYKDHYEVFRSALDNLYQAAKLAYSLAAEPDQVTKSNLDEYHSYASSANSDLQESNEILGQNYKTLEGVEKANLTGSSSTTIKGITVANLFDGTKKRYVNVHAKAVGSGHPPGIACADLTPTTNGESGSELKLTSSRDSGVSGTATFEDVEGGVKVTLQMQGLPEAGVEHLAHIHEGASCQDDRNDEGGPIEFPLEPVKASSS